MNRWRACLAAAAVSLAVAAPAGAKPATVRRDDTTPAAQARATYAAMTPAQRVGQLFMAGLSSSAPAASTITALRVHHVGNVIFDRSSQVGVAGTAAVSGAVDTALLAAGAEPFVAADQEGGEVQRLSGPGFSTMPTALRQGQMSTTALRRDATRWGRELAAAGVTLNLAPDGDVVPGPDASANQPIGRYHREFGHTPGVVASHVVAVVRGETAGGVDVTLKHFPGLGRASGDTDTARRVTDPTTRHDSYLEPFRRGIAAGAPFVMVSLATYPNIDPNHLACLSKVVVTGLLRGELGFTGIVISDSFAAKAVRSIAPAKAAVAYFTAGGTMLLDPDRPPLYAMERAVLVRAKADPDFARLIEADVLAVLRAKASAGLLSTVQS